MRHCNDSSFQRTLKLSGMDEIYDRIADTSGWFIVIYLFSLDFMPRYAFECWIIRIDVFVNLSWNFLVAKMEEQWMSNNRRMNFIIRIFFKRLYIVFIIANISKIVEVTSYACILKISIDYSLEIS